MFDLISLIKTLGYIGVFSVIFAESGLLIGFFLPGDSLLFTAGFLASQGVLNIWALCIGTFVAAVLGDNVGYWFGKKVGPQIFSRPESIFFNPQNVQKTNEFFEKHGKKSIILARFIPIVRTFTPILAGVGVMHYSTFFLFNIIGGALWAIGVTLLGFFLGNVIPNVDHYLLPIIIGIIFVSLLPTFIHILKDKHTRDQLWAKGKHILNKLFKRA